MTLFFIIVGAIVAGLVLLAALALCKAARMGDEAQARFIQDERLREKGEGVISITFGNGETCDIPLTTPCRRHEDAKDWEVRL